MEMENIRIESQGRKGYNGRKYIEFFNVIADTERFGENEIMFQGTFDDCVEYLKREGYNYQNEALKSNGKEDIQIANRMFRVESFKEETLYLVGRDGWEVTIKTKEMIPIAPNRFHLSWSPARGFNSTLKLGNEKTW